ncbi:MAG: hypothetical protein IPF46_13445 [Saprospiraceae bacterium]|nr:hypothetical protein [Candidatus Vicinibacter affinis]MBK6573885.1 hypothetical protein [Candidatus Vicinibacter affinis]MBK6821674.1 hypothetical protein [Candidatus Vicinibacter affinis]MBK7695210.1 hypothetical protein [Candidatus Vicinibacter affinis]MBK7800171.1 hypothetical protein [Candidatus Vicinibacter affinis]
MSAIIIKGDKKSSKLISELAKQLGANVIGMKEQQYEDFLLGYMMDKSKTGKTVSRTMVFKKLKSK